jgi:hypothetical protein
VILSKTALKVSKWLKMLLNDKKLIKMAKNDAKSHFKNYFIRAILKHFWPFWTKVSL